MDSFTERMAQAKELAQIERNKGRHVGKSALGWNRKRSDRLPMDGLDRLQFAYDSWRKEIEYTALAAVETALFAHEYDEFLRAEGWL